MNVLRDNNQSMISQISENVRMEKKIKVQAEVIRELQDRITIAEKVNKDDQASEIENLFLEIEQLKNTNRKKFSLMAYIEQEKEILKDNLENVEKKTLKLRMKQ